MVNSHTSLKEKIPFNASLLPRLCPVASGPGPGNFRNFPKALQPAKRGTFPVGNGRKHTQLIPAKKTAVIINKLGISVHAHPHVHWCEYCEGNKNRAVHSHPQRGLKMIGFQKMFPFIVPIPEKKKTVVGCCWIALQVETPKKPQFLNMKITGRWGNFFYHNWSCCFF